MWTCIRFCEGAHHESQTRLFLSVLGLPSGGGAQRFFPASPGPTPTHPGAVLQRSDCVQPSCGWGDHLQPAPGLPTSVAANLPQDGGGGLSGRAVWTKAVDPDRKRSTPLRIVGALVGRLCLIVLSRPPRGGVGAAPIGPRGHISEPRSFGEAVH